MKKNKIRILAICGKSAAGKDTLMQEILKLSPYLHELISHTTRPPREGEIDGINYHFISDEEFNEQMYNGKMLEFTCFRNWWYGTSFEALDPDTINVGVFNPAGIEALYLRPDVDPYVVLVTASDKTRLLRSLNREENPDVKEIVRRFMVDEQDFDHFYGEMALVPNDDNSHLALAAVECLEAAKRHWAEETN